MRLIVITRGYPVNTEELSFIKQELEILENSFSIIMLPKYNVVELDENEVKYPVIKCNCNIPIYKKIQYAIKGLLDIRLWREIVKFIRNGNFTICILRQIVAEMALSKHLDKILTKTLKQYRTTEPIIIYSYWFDYSLLSAVKKKKENIKVITRAHGFDLYNERCETGTQVFKEQLDRYIDRVFFISQYGKDYYCENFVHGNLEEDKYILNYLGVKKQAYQPVGNNKVFRLVSCSNVLSIKRIDKIIEALTFIEDFEIEWTHIGGGEMLDEIKSLANKSIGNKKNVKCFFAGNLLSNEVMQIYREQYFDCFILLSETEGLPVSIMEAMSFGIPVIANDVGGIKEIVNDTNGFLVNSYDDVRIISEVIHKFYYLDINEKEKIRENAYKTWKEKYNSYDNAIDFANRLKTLV